ncbi:MAG: hypothetical protein II892_09760 [Fibrobacter sp.]|jgi:anti-anti-sigma regulatory factor|nr:hypothetical protein [Fibrobacter sp.]
MDQLKNYREVGIFDLLSAPLNPIGAFDAEQFKKDVRALLDERSEDKFVAVDLAGLDFLYSDAYNALLLFQTELSARGGMMAMLTNNTTIIDGLKKAGLDKKLKVFAFEAEMMAFSLHNQAPQEPSMITIDPVEPVAEPQVASQNTYSGTAAPAPNTSLERRTGSHRKFTKSFNAISKDEEKLAKKGMNMPFDEEKSPARTVLTIILLVVLIGGLLAYLLI